MEIHQIKYFLTACETLNFTRAAEDRNVSQPALTKAIHLLEQELGGVLFDTQSRPIRLTAFGEFLRDRFAQVDDLMTDIKSMSTRFHSLEDSSFTLGVVNTMGNDRFIDVIRRIQEQLLGVSIMVRHASQMELIEALKAGHLELAIMTSHPPNSALLSGFPLYSEPYRLCARADHPLAKAGRARLRDLAEVDYIDRSHCEKGESLRALLRDYGNELKSQLASDQEDFVRLMINAGFGVSIMPESLIEPPLQSIPITDFDLERVIRFVYRKDRILSPVATKVRDAAEDVSRRLPVEVGGG